MRKTQMLAPLILLCATALAPAKQLGWKQLFDGKDLSGWKHVGPGSFIVEHGLEVECFNFKCIQHSFRR